MEVEPAAPLVTSGAGVGDGERCSRLGAGEGVVTREVEGDSRPSVAGGLRPSAAGSLRLNAGEGSRLGVDARSRRSVARSRPTAAGS